VGNDLRGRICCCGKPHKRLRTRGNVGAFTTRHDELNRTEMSALRERRLVFHGLRKSAVVFLLEAGCSDAETEAITGQSRDMVEHYAKQVNQKRLAAAAILKWEATEAARTQNAEGGEFVQPSLDLVQLGRQRKN
jgi:hypothetical protein